jgi:glucosamine--fructose-6-phosphate aminotransferase (isomerizing)
VDGRRIVDKPDGRPAPLVLPVSIVQMSLRSEIAEQPAVVRRLLAEGLAESDAHAARLSSARSLTLVARGSSDNAATYGKYLFESVAGIVTASAAPSLVTRYRAAPSFAGAAVIGISQSGSSPDVAAVVAEARADGAFTLALTNSGRSRLAGAADATFLLRCGRERAIAATKTYTASCVALALLASATARARGRDVITFSGLVDAVREAADREADAARLARRIGAGRVLVVLGRGYDYAAALEGALKIKELARVWAEPYSSADFAHGPRTLLERGTPVLVFASRGATLGEAKRVAKELGRRGARVFAITNDERFAESAEDAVLLRAEVAETLAPIALSVVAQHVAACLARRHGRDPERPAGLSKVTRTL